VDKHRNREVTLRKFLRDHAKMIPYGFLARRVGGVVTRYFDRSAIGKKVKMMSRPFVTKTHALIATGVDGRKMAFLTGRGWLGDCAQAQEAGCHEKKEVNQLHVLPR
jgi:hypothetical protein